MQEPLTPFVYPDFTQEVVAGGKYINEQFCGA